MDGSKLTDRESALDSNDSVARLRLDDLNMDGLVVMIRVESSMLDLKEVTLDRLVVINGVDVSTLDVTLGSIDSVAE